MNIICPICKRDTPDRFQEKHHLIPRGLAKRNKYAKLSDEEKGDETVAVCYDCHDALHEFLSNKDLADKYNTVEKMLRHEKVINWVKWIAKKSMSFHACHSSKKSKSH